jgi:hypothetical protein
MTKKQAIQDTIRGWDGHKVGNFLDFLLEKGHITLDEWNYYFYWLIRHGQ